MSLQFILVLHILEQWYLVLPYDFGLSILRFLAIQTVLDMFHLTEWALSQIKYWLATPT